VVKEESIIGVLVFFSIVLMCWLLFSDSKVSKFVRKQMKRESDFVAWDGTGVPVSERDRVEVIFRDGRRGGGRFFNTCEAWEHDGNDDDIVAYRILK
jgi:hypothetical protein